MTNKSSPSYFCSFCGKHKDFVKVLIAGPSVYICNECIDLCVEIVRDHLEKKEKQENDIVDV